MDKVLCSRRRICSKKLQILSSILRLNHLCIQEKVSTAVQNTVHSKLRTTRIPRLDSRHDKQPQARNIARCVTNP